MVCFTESELQQHEELIIARALAEKDLQWKRRIGLDCGGHSCFYAFEKTGMRHNGPCSCNPKRTKEEHDQLYQAYQQLMEQAIRLAKYLDQCPAPTLGKATAQAFLQSPEVQAWKEQQK